MTAFDQIIDSVAALLAGAPAVCTTIRTDEVDEFPEEISQAVEIDLGNSAAATLGGLTGNPLDWQTPVRITCHAKATTGATARQAANALVAAVYARLMATPDLGLGNGAHLHPELQLNWAAARKAHRMAACEMHMTVIHRTTNTNLT
jgi:hypothetical protein